MSICWNDAEYTNRLYSPDKQKTTYLGILGTQRMGTLGFAMMLNPNLSHRGLRRPLLAYLLPGPPPSLWFVPTACATYSIIYILPKIQKSSS